MGNWLIKNVDGNDHAICSVCGDDTFLDPEWTDMDLWNYCPNCGAKMKESKTKYMYNDWLIQVKNYNNKEYMELSDDEQHDLYEEYLRS